MSLRWLVPVTLLATACSVAQPNFPLDRFVAGDLLAVEGFAAGVANGGDEENLALALNVQAQCEMLRGDLDDARRNFERAGQIMGSWATSGSEATGAILGSESSKTWKGDPYEQAMNSFYVALNFLWKGEPDNARAACKRGILRDAEVGDEKYQADNPLLFWMAGRMSTLAGSSGAEDFFKEAVAANEFAGTHGSRVDGAAALLAEPQKGNLVLVCECGMGPEKYADGLQKELARFRPRPHPAVGAIASLDGNPLGRAAILDDLYYQARTLGGTEMEGIRKGKAVFKTAAIVSGAVLLDQATKERNRDKARTEAIVGGGLLLVGLLTSASADTRHWPTLPDTVQVLTVDAAPGTHRLVVDFVDANGRSLPGLQQTADVTVPATGEAWFLFRSIPPQPAATAPTGPTL